MEKWIILIMVKPNEIKKGISDLEDIAVCNLMDGTLMVFDSIDEAEDYQEKFGISGKKVELPLY